MRGRVVEEEFDSPGPVAMTPGLLTPLPWPGWRARMRSLDVDGTRADYVEIGPYRLDVPPLEDRAGIEPRMMLTVILEGRSSGTVDGQALTLGPKEAALIDGRASMRFHAPEPVRAVRIFVDHDHLPADVLPATSLPFAKLKATPLVAACVGFITGLLQVSSPFVSEEDEAAVSQPLIALQASLLNEALFRDGTSPQRPPAAAVDLDRRRQIELLVERDLGDPDLSVAFIAAKLGVTVRTVHAVYDGLPDTIGAYIRARRLVRAQALLASRDEPPNVGVLAARVGLSRDQLTRVFKSGTGLTTRQWWERHRADAPGAG